MSLILRSDADRGGGLLLTSEADRSESPRLTSLPGSFVFSGSIIGFGITSSENSIVIGGE